MTLITIKNALVRQEFNLDELDEMQISNLRFFLEQQAMMLREKMFRNLQIWSTKKAWEEWRLINGQLDRITNYLACARCK